MKILAALLLTLLTCCRGPAAPSEIARGFLPESAQALPLQDCRLSEFGMGDFAVRCTINVPSDDADFDAQIGFDELARDLEMAERQPQGCLRRTRREGSYVELCPIGPNRASFEKWAI